MLKSIPHEWKQFLLFLGIGIAQAMLVGYFFSEILYHRVNTKIDDTGGAFTLELYITVQTAIVSTLSAFGAGQYSEDKQFNFQLWGFVLGTFGYILYYLLV